LLKWKENGFRLWGGQIRLADIGVNAEEIMGDRKDRELDILRVNTAYKTEDRKVVPVKTEYPKDCQTKCSIPEDPLLTLPVLTPHPPEFFPSSKITMDRFKEIELNADGYLLPEEEKLMAHILKLNEDVLAWTENERGTFKRSYFSDYKIPVKLHTPWEYKPIPIPPGHKEEFIKLLKDKIKAGVYEPSQASYRSRCFAVVKKNGKLQIVHDLQPLNAVAIRDAGVPPVLDEFVEGMAGAPIYTCFDVYSGYDARILAEESRDLTSFMTPLGMLRISVMPQGYTHAVSEYQQCMVFILAPEIPDICNVFIDDAAIKGPASFYLDEKGQPEYLKENPGIRRFVWEHANDVHRIMHRVKCAGGTFSGKKTQMGRREVSILGQTCCPEGRKPDRGKIAKVLDWPDLKSVKEVRSFLGLCGTMKVWIENYSSKVRLLTMLIRKGTEFIWGQKQQLAFQSLKEAITSAPVLQPIDYTSDRAVVLSVDSSKIVVGLILSQRDENGRKRPAHYGSIPMNKVESNYSQAKLELYGLFRAMRAFRLYI
jgi:hypothetical protein